MPAMTSDPPAGYFSTFSILDPNNPSAEGQPKSQKRNRRVFVCIPCHKRKLRCDKGSPCSRCVSSGAAKDCVYQAFPSRQKSTSRAGSEESRRSSPKISPQDHCKTSYRPSDGRATVNGTSHWAKVACEIPEAGPYIYGTDPRWEPRYRQIKNLKYLFPSLNGANFPFSNICPYELTKLQIIEGLPPRHVVNALVVQYMESMETTHRLLHPLQFQEELESFADSPEHVLDGWLAQLCMILALGSANAPAYLLEGTGRTVAQWTEWFLDMAQLCLSRSPFMSMPNLTTMRTLCMVVIAKLMELRSSTPSQLVSFMGFVSRTAVTLQLHRSPALFSEMPAFDAEMRRRLWITVQLLDLDVAMRSGTSYLCLEQDSDAPSDVNESDFYRESGAGWVANPLWTTAHEYKDATFQVQLAGLLPLLAEVINTVNSPTQPAVEYEKVLSWDARIRQKQAEVEAVLRLGQQCPSKRAEKATMQMQFLEVIIHRTLLALHHAYACAPKSKHNEQSHFTSIESCFALLDIQQAWAPPSSARSSSSGGSIMGSPGSSPSMMVGDAIPRTWLVDLCHDDFGIAVLYFLVSLRGTNLMAGPDDIIPPSQVAWAAVIQALDILRERACRSVQHFKEFLGLSILCTAVRCRMDAQPMLPKMMEIANDVEQVIILGKHGMIWTGDSLDFGAPAGPPQVDTASLMAIDSDLLGTF